MINSDDIHFVDFKNKHELSIKDQISSFICNNRVAGEDANKMLKVNEFQPQLPMAL
jgi:hypothetical protein